MKYILKALNSELKVLSDNLEWHKQELREIKTSRLKAIRERDDLKKEKEVLMKVIEDLKNK